MTAEPDQLLHELATRLWGLADDAARDLAAKASELAPEPNPPAPLQGRLLGPFDQLPETNPLAKLAHAVLGDLGPGKDVRLHGWKRGPGPEIGVALVASKGNGRAVLAVTPGPPPKVDVVVTPGERIEASVGGGAWKASAEVESGAVWDTEIGPGSPPALPVGTVKLSAEHGKLVIGTEQGPGISAEAVTATLRASPTAAPSFGLELKKFRAALVPDQLAGFLGAGADRGTSAADLKIDADADGGVRFDGGLGLRVELPVSLALPAVSVRGFAIELEASPAGVTMKPTFGLAVDLPGLPVHADLDSLGIEVPFALSQEAIGSLAGQVTPTLLEGFGIELKLPPVSGGGSVRSTGKGYAGALDLDLGVFRVQAFGVVQLPQGGEPTSIIALLSAFFPYPGIQLGFGFAIDAVGGIVGINRRVDTEQLRTLVSDGHADRVLFPENLVERAEEITRSLDASFPAKRGRFVIGPMVRLNWSGRLVTLSGAVVLDLPGPSQIVILGRLLVAIPDPAAPLIRLQASVLGRIDPTVPETEVLVSLAGSRIVTTPVSGEIYLLVRGGDQAVFVLSAGGFHPRYTRPPGVPALKRLTMDLGGGFLGLRAEAYLAVTSNALMFGANLHLDATIAGCGVEGQLGLDALFVWEPTFSFSVHVYASVAVLAFGHRLASVGLDFTLEGPEPWHAFGTGSISILFWDVSLDFDVRWGEDPPAAIKPAEVKPLLREALERASAWSVERPPEQRNGVKLSAKARADLASGAAIAADAIYRVSQTVVPLATTISRFSRTKVPEQRWEIAGGTEVKDRFIPGEFFDLKADEQLTGPAFVEEKSGISMSDTEVRIGKAHLVDDSYETGYKVENGFQAEDPGISFHLVRKNFARERFGLLVGPDERLSHWRSVQESLASNKVLMT